MRRRKEQTRKSTTEIVKASSESYFEAIHRPQSPAEILKDLIGNGRGPANLSKDYKKYLTDSLADKGRR